MIATGAGTHTHSPKVLLLAARGGCGDTGTWSAVRQYVNQRLEDAYRKKGPLAQERVSAIANSLHRFSEQSVHSDDFYSLAHAVVTEGVVAGRYYLFDDGQVRVTPSWGWHLITVPPPSEGASAGDVIGQGPATVVRLWADRATRCAPEWMRDELLPRHLFSMIAHVLVEHPDQVDEQLLTLTVMAACADFTDRTDEAAAALAGVDTARAISFLLERAKFNNPLEAAGTTIAVLS